MNKVKTYLIIGLICWLIFIIYTFLIYNKILLLIILKAIKIIFSGDYNLNFSNISWINILFALVGIIFYITVTLPIFKEKNKKIFLIEPAISFIFGLGIISIILELFGIFYLLNQEIVIIVFSILIVLSWLCFKRRIIKINYYKTITTDDTNKYIFFIFFLLITLTTLFTFYHALFYPETYWDSLIYYLHYGKMIYQEHGFPTLVCAQVGLGLGANYPHLFPLSGGTISILFGGYSDLFGQVIAPIAGLLATILIYFIAKELFQSKTIAITTALLFRSIPFGIAYFTYATDYAVVMLFTAGFLYVSLRYLNTKEKAWLWLTGLIAAFQTHINYLGWLFFPILILLIFLSKEKTKIAFSVLSISLLLSLPWYIRNWLVTGNPVYAFFPQIFGGKHIDPEVLASCYKEWAANGIGVPGTTIAERVINTPQFLFYDWRFAPVLLGLAIPGIVVGLFDNRNAAVCRTNLQKHFLYLTAAILGLGFFYHLVISSLYLYQIIFIIPGIAILSGYFINAIIGREDSQIVPEKLRRMIKWLILVVVLFVGLVPGLAMSIMGHKYANPNLVAFQHPGIEKMRFMELVYGDAVPMWEYINKNLKDIKLLTHDNRYHMYNDDIKIIHLDDWDIQPLYNISSAQDRLAKFQQMGIQYYLFIPNERNHPIVKKLKLNELIVKDYLKEIYSVGEHKIYQFNYELLGQN